MGVALFGQAGRFNEKGELERPSDYREWVYLGTGLGMTYFDAGVPGALETPFFDSVFVNPEAWKKFKTNGVWPDGTTFILEIRYSAGQSGINKAGFFQSDIATLEAAVKDSKRFEGNWGYFQFGNAVFGLRDTSPVLPKNAGCIACHTANAAVENSFTQFYPEALRVALEHKTVKANYAGAAPVATPAEFSHALRDGGWEAAKAMIDRAKAKDQKALILREAQLNQVGYAMLQAGKKAEAIAVMRFVVETNPGSANAWDSLSEVLEANGDKAGALEAAKKCLQAAEAAKDLRPGQKEQLQKIAGERVARLRK